MRAVGWSIYLLVMKDVTGIAAAKAASSLQWRISEIKKTTWASMTSDELVAKIFVEDLPTITSVDCGTQISRLSRRFLTLHARDTPANSRWSFFAAGIAAQLQFHGELSNTGARVDMEWRGWKPVSQCKSKLFPFIPSAGTAKPYGENTLGSVDTLSLISEINFPSRH